MESQPLAWDFDGKPISLREWGSLMDDPRARVGNANIGRVWVATDWVGTDVGMSRRDERPQIYETMIFPRRDRDKNAPGRT